jgi:hypothetical protein
MKRTLRLAALGIVIASALAFATAVSADVVMNSNEPWSETPFSDCTGETVLLEGTVHSVVRFSFSNGRTHIGSSSSWSALKGTGMTSGARYVETRIENFGGNMDSDVMPMETNTETIQILTRLGEDGAFVMGDDLRVHISAHMTVNANGTVTADHTDSRVECN